VNTLTQTTYATQSGIEHPDGVVFFTAHIADPNIFYEIPPKIGVS
jgi:hypothetical protein